VEEGVVDKVRAAGGEVFAVTSEPQRLADQAHEYWELSFENVGDPHQEISKTCSEQGWLTLYANRGNLDFLQGGADWEIEHPKGFFSTGRFGFDEGAPGALSLALGTLKREFKRHRDAANGRPRMGKLRAGARCWRLGGRCST
jgi:hypothetical protein